MAGFLVSELSDYLHPGAVGTQTSIWEISASQFRQLSEMSPIYTKLTVYFSLNRGCLDHKPPFGLSRFGPLQILKKEQFRPPSPIWAPSDLRSGPACIWLSWSVKKFMEIWMGIRARRERTFIQISGVGRRLGNTHMQGYQKLGIPVATYSR